MCSSRLLWEVWLPVMRSSVSGWQPRSVGPMVDCVEVWAPLLPGWITEHLLEQLVLPRLQREARHTHTAHRCTPSSSSSYLSCLHIHVSDFQQLPDLLRTVFILFVLGDLLKVIATLCYFLCVVNVWLGIIISCVLCMHLLYCRFRFC